MHRKLLVQAFGLGHRLTEVPDLRVFADGVALAAESPSSDWLRFEIPAGARRLRLCSRSFVPATIDSASTDMRRLGVAVQLQLDGSPLRPEAFAAGWHPPEGDVSWRWTDGDAALLLPRRSEPASLALRLMDGRARYWLPPPRGSRQGRSLAIPCEDSAA